MAKVQKADKGLNTRLDEFEKQMFVLKLTYEKYFSGQEPIEPVRDRDDVRRMLRDLQLETINNTAQRHRLTTLKARYTSLDLYLTRNLVLWERGQHPRQKFKADLHERERSGQSPEEQAAAARPRRLTPEEKDELAFRAVFEKYVEARKQCNQPTDLNYDSVRDVLKKQVTTIKTRFGCKSVKFRVTVEEGKAKVKAVPLT